MPLKAIMKCAVATGIALFPGISYERSDCTIGSGDRNMMNGINDELILAARLLVPSGMRLEFGGGISGNMRLSFQAARSIG